MFLTEALGGLDWAELVRRFLLSQDTSRPGSRFAAFLPGSGPYSARREDDVFRIDDVAVLSSAEAVTPPDDCSLEATDEAWMSVDDAQGDLWKFITPSERKKTVWMCVCIAGPLSGVTLRKAERAATVTHLMTLDGLARALVEQYEQLDERGRNLIPLTKIYWPLQV